MTLNLERERPQRATEKQRYTEKFPTKTLRFTKKNSPADLADERRFFAESFASFRLSG